MNDKIKQMCINGICFIIISVNFWGGRLNEILKNREVGVCPDVGVSPGVYGIYQFIYRQSQDQVALAFICVLHFYIFINIKNKKNYIFIIF